MFSSELIENPMLLKTTLLSVVTILAATEIGILQRVLGTVGLSLEQWGICLAVALAIVVVAEINKVLHIRTTDPVALASATAATTPV